MCILLDWWVQKIFPKGVNNPMFHLRGLRMLRAHIRPQRVPVLLMTFPTTIPAWVTPIAPTPAAELGAVDGAAFAILEHAFLSVGIAGTCSEAS